MRTTRRAFLSWLGTGASLAALARVRPGPAAAAGLPPEIESGFFSEREREILTQLVERLVDTGRSDAPAVRDTRAIETIDAVCAGLDPVLTRPLGIVLRLFEWGPLIFDFAFVRFTRMSDAQKDASLRAWMTSRIGLRRTAFAAVRNLAFLGYYSQESTWPLIQYAGPLLGRETPT